jgi:hypothetical protein
VEKSEIEAFKTRIRQLERYSTNDQAVLYPDEKGDFVLVGSVIALINMLGVSESVAIPANVTLDKIALGNYTYYVDGVQYETELRTMTGMYIRAMISGIEPDYSIFQEESNNITADIQILDASTVSLTDGPLHFYTVPPATFGTKDGGGFACSLSNL